MFIAARRQQMALRRSAMRGEVSYKHVAAQRPGTRGCFAAGNVWLPARNVGLTLRPSVRQDKTI